MRTAPDGEFSLAVSEAFTIVWNSSRCIRTRTTTEGFFGSAGTRRGRMARSQDEEKAFNSRIAFRQA